MGLAEFRLRIGKTQGQASAELGLASKGYYSRLENGHVPWPIKLALEVESWSAGVVLAVELLEPKDAALLTAAIERAIKRALDRVAA